MGDMPKHAPPTLQGLALFRRLATLRTDTLKFITDAVNEYGDVVCIKTPVGSGFLINHPDGIRHVLQDNHRNYTKDTLQYSSLAEITGRGLLTSDGDMWFQQRRLEQPAFSRPRLAALDQIVVPSTHAMLEHWSDRAGSGELLDVDAEMMGLTLEVVGKALFSLDLRQDAGRLTHATLDALDHIVHRLRNPVSLGSYLPGPERRRFSQAVKTLDVIIADMVAARRQASDPGDDMLGMLLKARDPQSGAAMDAKLLRDEIITLLIAGHETVASALTWTWYLLAQNPDIRQQMQAEIGAVLGGRAPRSDDLPALTLPRHVFSEALRLYPPAWIITRRAMNADEIGGYVIPPNSLVILCPYTAHRHPQFWSDPERFDPSRFVEGIETGRPRYAYIPFGGGPRMCIGAPFAQLEAALILTTVTQHYRLELPPGAAVALDALVTIRPKGGLRMQANPVSGVNP